MLQICLLPPIPGQVEMAMLGTGPSRGPVSFDVGQLLSLTNALGSAEEYQDQVCLV